MQTLQLATAILKRFPYRALAMDAAMSERIFDRYIKTLDPEKSIFLQSDIDRFAEARRNLGAEIERGDLKIPFEVFRTYEQRIGERLAHARELLNKGFDFTRNDSFEFNREKAPHPASEDEARAIWHKRVKNDWLQLKLAGKEDAAIRETLDKRYANLVSRIRKYRNDDVFQAFMDAFATSVDPHTDYFAPAESANFDIAMKLSLVGIGAVLQDKDEYATIRELVPGGPAALSSRLKVGDRIVGVGQGSDGPIVDVVGMRLDEVVDLIRGPKDSTVRLNVLPADAGPDGKLELIALVRNKISLEQQAARKTIIEANVEGGKRRVGVISLPAFYQDFDARKRGEGDFRSATRDTIRLLDELKKEGVDAVLVDLRNNGGGSLEEAVALTGLFTGTGPVVQERNAQGQVRVDSSTLPKPAWDGPMGVLINRGSASASEIFAAAIQDYGRGVIIGEPSFGKGTVQTILNLDQIAQNEKAEYGELKMTIAQFFRINGATTQLRGVTPDISFPPITDLEHFGEASYDNALPATHVRAASYSPSQAMADMIPELTRRHTERIARDRQFQLLIEDVAELQARRKSARITLNEAERIKERDARQARLKLRERNDAPADPGARDTAKAGSVEPKTGARRDPLLSAATPGNATEATEKDVVDAWMIEAAHIVADAAALRGNRTRYAAGAAEVAR
ncbi:MAG TPA: carboxy terminal-processing peptidase [Noviherbaspirillum sp.]